MTRSSVETERVIAKPQPTGAVAEALALTNARLVDGSGAPPRTGATVVVADGRIVSVSEEAPTPGAATLDLEGRTMLPGLIDAHVHLSSLGLPDVSSNLQEYGLAFVARKMLEGGFTTVRDLGSYGNSLFRLREAIDLGLCQGPRLVLCGQIVAATSPGARAFPGMYCEADGPDGMRRAVREQIRQGADFVKVMSTGALTVADEDVNPAQLTAEELAAVVDESHRTGFSVASHAEGLAGIRLSVDAGVDTLEHGEMAFEDPGILAAMAEQGIVLVPTLCVFDLVAEGDGFPEWMRERAKFLRESAEKTVAAARREGVAMAVGADAGPHGENARELVRLVETGLLPMEAIVAATSTAARACRLEDELGTIEPGKAADLLVLDGDALADVRLFLDPARRWLVLQAGRPVAGTQAVTTR
jgi:imidazolonepropionase-like amidohydrolase